MEEKFDSSLPGVKTSVAYIVRKVVASVDRSVGEISFVVVFLFMKNRVRKRYSLVIDIFQLSRHDKAADNYKEG